MATMRLPKVTAGSGAHLEPVPGAAANLAIDVVTGVRYAIIHDRDIDAMTLIDPSDCDLVTHPDGGTIVVPKPEFDLLR